MIGKDGGPVPGSDGGQRRAELCGFRRRCRATANITRTSRPSTPHDDDTTTVTELVLRLPTWVEYVLPTTKSTNKQKAFRGLY